MTENEIYLKRYIGNAAHELAKARLSMCNHLVIVALQRIADAIFDLQSAEGLLRKVEGGDDD